MWGGVLSTQALLTMSMKLQYRENGFHSSLFLAVAPFPGLPRLDYGHFQQCPSDPRRLIWLLYLRANGWSIKQGYKGFVYIAVISAVIAAFYTAMMFLTGR